MIDSEVAVGLTLVNYDNNKEKASILPSRSKHLDPEHVLITNLEMNIEGGASALVSFDILMIEILAFIAGTCSDSSQCSPVNLKYPSRISFTS